MFDDLPAIVENKDVTNTNANLSDILKHDFWGEDLASDRSHGSYRPLAVIVFKFLAEVRGQMLDPRVFHALNHLLHIFNICLVYKFVAKFSKTSSFIVALLFALHPIHTEPVVAAVGLADLFYSTVFLGACCLKICLPRNSLLEPFIIASLTVISTLIKEQGIMIIPTIIAIDLIVVHGFSKKHILFNWMHLSVRLTFYTIALGVILYCRLEIMDFKQPKFKPGDNPSAFLPILLDRAVNKSYLYALNMWLLINPEWLCFDWAMGCVPMIKDLDDPRMIGVALFWTALFMSSIKALKYGDRKLLLGLALLVLPFLPASGLFFNVGFVIAERNLYLPALGYLVIVATGYKHLVKLTKLKKTLTFALVTVVIAFCARSYTRALDWRVESKLFKSGLKVCPSNAKVYYNIGKNLADKENTRGGHSIL